MVRSTVELPGQVNKDTWYIAGAIRSLWAGTCSAPPAAWRRAPTACRCCRCCCCCALAGPDPLDPLSALVPTGAPFGHPPRLAATEDFGFAPIARAVR